MSSVYLIYNLFFSLIATIIIELSVIHIIVKRLKKIDAGLIVLVNIITNPAVVMLHMTLVIFKGLGLWLNLIMFVVEVAVVFVEGSLYKKYSAKFKRPFLIALIANGVTYGLSLLVLLLSYLTLNNFTFLLYIAVGVFGVVLVSRVYLFGLRKE